MLKLAENTTIRDQVLQQVRNLITSNTIPPGDRLYEEKLASEIGVSRTPIREALHTLEREGFLESIPRVGYVVKIPEIEDFEEIIEIRQALESLTAISAAHKLNKSFLKDVENNLKKTYGIIKKGEVDKFMDLNDEFHEIIDKASGKKRICEMNRRLRDYMYFYRIRNIIDKSIAQRALAAHERIVKAIKNKDEDKIRQEICSHLEGLKTRALTNIFKDTSDDTKGS